MNSEELEQSLRTEFENYLNGVVAETRQEISRIQEKVEDEMEKYKARLDEVFQDAFARVNAEVELDAGFREAVVEHLRLARDEGARITATAIAEAEEMEKQSAAAAAAAEAAPPRAGFAELRAAIDEISGKTSQSEILKSLVNHAAEFAPRGAFFIVKNDHFVGWRTFGREKGDNEEAVRELFLPVGSDSVLSEAVRSLAAVESSAGTYAADEAILEKLEFGAPEKMYAIPLMARGRGVAVLYADHGEQDSENSLLDVDALETMVRVAGLTVELLASAKGAPKKRAVAESRQPQINESFHEPAAQNYQTPAPAAEIYGSPAANTAAAAVAFDSAAETSFQPSFRAEDSGASVVPPPAFAAEDYSASRQSYAARDESSAPVESFRDSAAQEAAFPTYDDSTWNQSSSSSAAAQYDESRFAPPQDFSTPVTEINAEQYSPQEFSFRPGGETQPASTEFQFEAGQSPQFESADAPPQSQQRTETFDSYTPAQAPVETQSYDYAPPHGESSYKSFETTERAAPGGFSDPAQQFGAQPQHQPQSVRTRFSDRNVDLPIEVTEDERRLHNDARRFARLLVSEIKLYNEQKVKEGREANDLYERLREAIDRSRDMYDKRVQPGVAAKFDYFHYELVNSLGEGDVSRLGAGYPGASV